MRAIVALALLAVAPLTAHAQTVQITSNVTTNTTWGPTGTVVGDIFWVRNSIGINPMRAEDSVGASDENTSVTVYDFRVWPDTVEVSPGDTATVSIRLDRNVDALGIYSTQYTVNFGPTHLTGIGALAAGLMGAWGTPTSNAPSGKVIVAGAGTGALGPGTTLNTVRIAVSPSAPVPSDIPLSLTGVLFNEGAPIGLVAPGLLRVRQVVGVPPDGARGFELARVKPNPSRGGAAFAFTLPSVAEGGRVRLAVYGVDGRLVHTVYDAPAVPGRHEARWDARTTGGHRAAPGLYFARLEWGGRTLARSFVVLE